MWLISTAVREASAVAEATVTYWTTLAFWLVSGGGIESPWPNQRLNTRQLAHTYSLATTLRIWDHPHYRAASFGADMRDNLRNVAVPGTGVGTGAARSGVMLEIFGRCDARRDEAGGRMHMPCTSCVQWATSLCMLATHSPRRLSHPWNLRRAAERVLPQPPRSARLPADHLPVALPGCGGAGGLAA